MPTASSSSSTLSKDSCTHPNAICYLRIDQCAVGDYRAWDVLDGDYTQVLMRGEQQQQQETASQPAGTQSKHIVRAGHPLNGTLATRTLLPTLVWLEEEAQEGALV